MDELVSQSEGKQEAKAAFFFFFSVLSSGLPPKGDKEICRSHVGRAFVLHII